MKILAGLLLLHGLHASATAGPIPTVELFWSGKVTPFYGDASGERQENLLAVVRHKQMAERMAAVAGAFRWKQNVDATLNGAMRNLFTKYIKPGR